VYKVEHTVTIEQVSTDAYPGRTKVFEFNFMASADGETTWAHLCDTFILVLPRKIYFKDVSTGKVTTWDKEPIYGNPNTQPLLLRGDRITVSSGYSYFMPNKNGTSFDRDYTVTQNIQRFKGYITRIKNKTPFEVECKDNMFILQQTPVSNKEWKLDGTTYTLEKMLKEMMKASTHPDAHNLTIQTDNYQHKLGKLSWANYTVAQVLDDLRKTNHLESFFVGNELRCGVIRYYPESRKTHTFHFQRNISDDNLDYQRADDLRIGIIAKSINKIEIVSVNSAGKKKTKHQELKVTVGDPDGELRTLFFWGVTSTVELKKQALKKLPFLKYEGFRGSFTTFSLPKVRHGDAVEFIDDELPERNGTYLVKSVQDVMTVEGGLKQRISLDIRIDHLSVADVVEFQKNGL
jgi:hypothetical protein